MRTKDTEIIYGEITESARKNIIGHLGDMNISISAHPENISDSIYLKLEPDYPFCPKSIKVFPYYKTDRVVYDVSKLNGYYKTSRHEFSEGRDIIFLVEKRDMPSFIFMTSNKNLYHNNL
jgi:hypothetical protein